MGFFRIFLLFLLAYLILRTISNIFRPKKNTQSFRQSPRNEIRPEGEVKVDINSKKEKKVSREEGDYVDFEEL